MRKYIVRINYLNHGIVMKKLFEWDTFCLQLGALTIGSLQQILQHWQKTDHAMSITKQLEIVQNSFRKLYILYYIIKVIFADKIYFLVYKIRIVVVFFIIRFHFRKYILQDIIWSFQNHAQYFARLNQMMINKGSFKKCTESFE